MVNSLVNKNVLITGGSSGIGNSIACGLAEKGAVVTVISRNCPKEWENTEFISWNTKINWLQIDLNDLNATTSIISRWLSSFGTNLDVFIHSAITYGANYRRPISDIQLNEWNNVFTVNTHSFFLITQLLLPYLLLRPQGLIIPISSEVAFNAGPGRADYAASKAAAHSFSKSLAEELAGTNIKVVSILPKNMVNTKGIRKRRKQGEDLSSYASPSIFIKPTIKILQSMGKGMHGKSFIIENDGTMALVTKNNLISHTNSRAKVTLSINNRNEGG